VARNVAQLLPVHGSQEPYQSDQQLWQLLRLRRLGQAGVLLPQVRGHGDVLEGVRTLQRIRPRRSFSQALLHLQRYLKEGHLYLCDRRADLVISGGANVYPAEVEMVLAQCPGVQDCAVFGIPDNEFGESLAAAVQRSPGAEVTAESIQRYLETHLARYKVPRLIQFHAELPREDSGKIFKRRLREPFWKKSGRHI
jgi:hypothetical protein